MPYRRLALCLASLIAAANPLAQSASGAASAGESTLKFALYSPAWGENSEDRIRLLAHNQSDIPIRLDGIRFAPPEGETVLLRPRLRLPAGASGDAVLDYVDLLEGDDCVSRSLADNWKLTEISNYTLNPSVRQLIIEDTDSFRIYQCVQTVQTQWTNLDSGEKLSREEWVLFHFESRRD